jgi:hypothetical protein
MKYSDLSRANRKLQAIPYDETDSSANDDYWAGVEVFKTKLKEALRDDACLRAMTKTQLWQFTAWCSSHRPVEPHIVLSTIGKLAAG